MTVQMHLRLKYSDIFSDTPEDLDEYLRPIGKTDLFKAAALFIKRSIKPHQFPSVNELVFNWFRHDLDFRDLIMSKLRPEHDMLNIISSLRFTEHVFRSDYHTTCNYTPLKLERNIFIAYLIFNEQQEIEEKEGFKNLPEKVSHLYLSSLLLCVNYRDYELTNYNLKNLFICQLIKSCLFFEYLTERPELRYHLLYFLNEFKKETWHEWIHAYLALVSLIIFQDNAKYNEIILPKNDELEQNKHFFQMFSLNHISDEQDYISIRSNPLLEVGENHYRVIYDLFLVEKLFKSIQFKFSLDINKKIDKQYKLGDFRADHCDKFSEQTLLYKMMENSFSTIGKHISGEKFKQAGFEAEPDYFIQIGNNIFLFESKDVILKGEEKQSRDFRVISEALKSKFYLSIDRKGKIENKAVLQLITNVDRLLNNYYSDLHTVNSNNVRIFPIIITHDRQFDSMGVNKLVATWFNDELREKISLKHHHKIKPPTIINIDTFILYQDLFNSRAELIFEELIANYHELSSIPRLKKNSMSQEAFSSKVQQSLISFQTYIDDLVLKKGLMKLPSIADEYLSKLSDKHKR